MRSQKEMIEEINSENSNRVSYELARDMAEVANTAHTAMQEVEVTVDAAQLIEKAGIEGVALEAGSLAVLARLYRVASNSFDHANNSVPSFRSEVVLDTTVDQVASELETLTPEEQAYKEVALEGLRVSYKTYTSVMDAMNNTKARKADKNKLATATEAETRTALEALLTPAQIRAEMAQIAEFTASPEANSPEAAFDTLFVSDEDLIADDETALANHLQDKLTAYRLEAEFFEPLHNQDAAHKSIGSGAKVRAIRVPKHLNVRAGNVATQKAAVEAHNNNPDTTYTIEMADDLTAMSHIALLIKTGAIDATTQRYDGNRFLSSYYKNVLHEERLGCVPGVYVSGDGRVHRGGSSIYRDDYSSRALVVPKA